MATRHWPVPPPPPPTFPQLPSSTAIPVPNVASNYLAVGPAQGSGRPSRNPSPRTTSSHLPPPYEPLSSQHQSAYPPASQPLPVSGRPHPAFPTPQVQITHAPTTHLDPPPHRVHRNAIMPIPDLTNDTHVALGFHPSHALQAPIMSHSQSHSGMSGGPQIPVDCQRNQYDPDHEEDWDDHDISATHNSGATPKGPPNRPVAGVQGTQNGSSSWVRRLVNRGNQPPNQTVAPAPPVAAPQQATFRCRLPGCQASITGEVAARLNGFCGDSHMWTAIHNRIATLCPRCNRRACPERHAFCSTACANRRY